MYCLLIYSIISNRPLGHLKPCFRFGFTKNAVLVPILVTGTTLSMKHADESLILHGDTSLTVYLSMTPMHPAKTLQDYEHMLLEVTFL